MTDEAGDANMVIDVESELVPRDAPEEAREAARALYRAKKSFGFDVKLLAGWLMHRARAGAAT